MIGRRIQLIREEKGYTLEELGQMVGRSKSTMSRVENQETYKADPELLNKIADALGVSVLFLINTKETHYQNAGKIEPLSYDQVIDVVVEDDDMSPEIREGAILTVRALMPNEKLQVGSYYCIEFNHQKKFRMAIDDAEDGLGFLPMHRGERRIAYDKEYVKIIGKVISMNVIFEDEIEYK